MGGRFFDTLSAIGLGIIAVALTAVIVSRKSQTPAVIQASGSAFGNSLAVAEAPVTGAQTRIDLSYPNSSGLGYFGFSPQFDVPGF